jgi:hypothetical protein
MSAKRAHDRNNISKRVHVHKKNQNKNSRNKYCTRVLRQELLYFNVQKKTQTQNYKIDQYVHNANGETLKPRHNSTKNTKIHK